MYSLPPLINGKAHEQSDITVFAMGQPFTNFTAIEYDEDQDIQNGWAAGKEVNYRTHGKITPTAKLSVLMGGMEALAALVPTGRVQDIPEFDITVTYVDSAYVTVVHVLKGCRIKNNGRKAATGDGAIIHEMELVVASIKWVK